MSAGLAMMPWFPGDFMRSTRGWSVTAKGVYREMLDAQWDLGSLPADEEELCAMIGATAAEWVKGWLKCESKFPVGSDGQRRNTTLEEHRTKSIKLAERHAKGAAKTNAQRYGERVAERDGERSHSDTHSGVGKDADSESPPSPSPSPSPVHTSPSNGEDGGRKPRAARSAATRIPDDFELTPDLIEYASIRGVDPGPTFEAFKLYWSNKPKDATKLDWNKTWQSWVLKDAKDAKQKNAPRKTRFDEIMGMRNGR